MRSVLGGCLFFVIVSVLAGILVEKKEDCVDVLVGTLLCLSSAMTLCILYNVHDTPKVPILGACCHMVFTIALTYGSLLASKPLRKLTLIMVGITLVTRNVFGGCLFNMIEGDGGVHDGNIDHDIWLYGMLGIGLARAMFRKHCFSQLEKEVGLMAIVLHTNFMWDR